MLRFLFILFNLALLTTVCLGGFLLGAGMVVNSRLPSHILIGMSVSGLSCALLLWGGEAVASLMFPINKKQ